MEKISKVIKNNQKEILKLDIDFTVNSNVLFSSKAKSGREIAVSRQDFEFLTSK